MDSELSSQDAASASKYRPIQSCLRCRERKVKCDREQPCGACRVRGQELECEYNTNDEERFQIKQNLMIGSLRREVNRLKRRLADVDIITPPSNIEVDEQGFYPRKALKWAKGDSARTPSTERANFPLNSSSAAISRQKETARTPTAYLSPEHRLDRPIPAEGAEQTMSSNVNSYRASSRSSSLSGSSSSQTCSSVEHERRGIDEHLGISQIPLPSSLIPLFPARGGGSASGYAGGLNHLHLGLWKGKRRLLEHIFNTLCDCDEAQVDTIIRIIRTSSSPEDAIISIRQAMQMTSIDLPAVRAVTFQTELGYVPTIPGPLSCTPSSHVAPLSLAPAPSASYTEKWPAGELQSRQFSYT